MKELEDLDLSGFGDIDDISGDAKGQTKGRGDKPGTPEKATAE